MLPTPVLFLLFACSEPGEKTPRDSPQPHQDSPPHDTAPDSPPTGTGAGTGVPIDTDSRPLPTDSDPPPVDTGTTAGQRYGGPNRVAVITAGFVKLVDPATGVATDVSGVGTPGSNVSISCVGDSIWVMDGHNDGTSDRVVRIDATAGTVTSTWDLGGVVRPTDIAKVGDYYWITSYAKDRIYVATDAGLNGTYVSLTAFADADALPEAMGVWNTGEQTAVVVGRFGQSDNTRNGAKLLLYNNNSYALEATIDLVGPSPSGRILVHDETLWLEVEATPSGATSLADSGIEEVNLGTQLSNGLRVDDSADGRSAYIAFLDGIGNVTWRGFTPATGGSWLGAWNLVDGTAQQSFSLSARVAGVGTVDGGTLWVGENGFDNVSGALVSRQTTNGAELTRTALDGPILAMSVCARDAP